MYSFSTKTLIDRTSIFVLVFCSAFFIQAQDAYIIVEDIVITGNKRTKSRVILTELDFRAGDTLVMDDNFETRTENNKKRILNTGMFNDVQFEYDSLQTNPLQKVNIKVVENWYIYPAPILELADRNFNVWWTEENRALNRLNYGMRAEHINLTGNRDKLTFTAQFGYTRKYEIRYKLPYLNKANTIGGSFVVFFSENKEIGYITMGNKTVFHKFEGEEDRVLLQRFRAGGDITYRPNLYHNHGFRLEYHNNNVDPYVAETLNPDYFLNGATGIQFFLFNYDYALDRRVFRLYPEGGYHLSFNFKKEGLWILNELNNASFFVGAEKYFSFGDLWRTHSKIKIKANIIRDQIAFANNTGLGYGEDELKGYELYVHDGTDYVYLKNALKFRFLNKRFVFGDIMPLTQFKVASIQLFLSANLDLGYVHEPSYAMTNEMNNRLLIGGGPSLDVILFNNYLFQFEYSINHLGEKGLFLHNKVSF